MRLSVRLRPILTALVIFGLAACGQSGGNGKPASPLTDPVVAATVNGKPIYIDDVLAEAVARGAIKEGEDLDPASPTFYQITEDLIETRLFAMEAEARGLDKDPDTRHRLDTARERILANVLNEHIATTALKESAIERMYREQVRLLKQGREVRARHILLDSKEAALAAKRRLDAGELFEALAYEISKDRSTAPDGGDLGYFLPEAMPDGFREIAQSTPVGAVGGPVQTEQGWHLVKIEERREAAPPSLESLRPKIVQWLMFEEQRRVVEKLKGSARIARLSDQGGAGVSARPGMETPDAAPEVEEEQPRAAAPAAPAPAPAIAATPTPSPKPAVTPAEKPRAPPSTTPKPQPVEPTPAPRASPPLPGSDSGLFPSSPTTPPPTSSPPLNLPDERET